MRKYDKRVLAARNMLTEEMDVKDSDDDDDIKEGDSQDGDNVHINDKSGDCHKSGDISNSSKHDDDIDKSIDGDFSITEDDIEEMYLMSQLLDYNTNKMMVDTLDHACPSLSSTPLVQEKALRIVLSAGDDDII